MSHIVDRLVKAEVSHEPLWHPPAFSAARRSHYLRRSGKNVAKSILLESARGPLIAVIPSAARLDTVALERIVGTPVRLVPQAKVAKILRDCECPAVPAFGRWLGLPVVLDRLLVARETVLFPTDRICLDLEMSPEAYLRFEQPTVAEIASPLSFKPAVGSTVRAAAAMH